MNNINKMFDGLGGIASLPGLGAGIGGVGGLLGGGMMSGGSSSGGNPAQALGQTPDYSYVDNLPSTVPAVPIPNVSVPDSVQAADPKQEFNYGKMLEAISAGSEYMSEASQDAQQSAGGATTRGSLPAQPMTNLYGNMGSGSPAMQAIQNSKSMIGAQPSIEQILQSLSR